GSSLGSSSTPTSVPVTGVAESPTASATASSEATPTPAVAPPPEKPTVTTPTPEPALQRIERTDKPRATVTIAGQIKDSGNNPITNVVVVIISPQGAVLTSTTDSDGNYSFTLAPSDHG